NQGLVKSATFTRQASPPVNLRRVVYTYYETGDTHGSPGDLQTATVQIYQSGAWQDYETGYYRYYLDGDPDGFAHGLKYALGPAAFQRLADDPAVTDPLTATDAQVAAHADFQFQYNAD